MLIARINLFKHIERKLGKDRVNLPILYGNYKLKKKIARFVSEVELANKHYLKRRIKREIVIVINKTGY